MGGVNRKPLICRMDLPKGVGCLMFFMKGWLIIGQTLEPLIILGQAATKGKITDETTNANQR